MKTCPTCHAAYADIVRYCAADGTPLVAGAPGDPPTQEAESEDQSGGWILTIAAIVAAALLGWYLTSTRAAVAPNAPVVEPQR